MIKHFNTYDVYQHSDFNIYPAEKMLYIDKLHSYCRYLFLEYLIDCNIVKHTIVNADGYVFILNMKLQGLWPSLCADFAKELIEKLDLFLFENSISVRDYVWFLKQTEKDSINVYIVIFGNKEIFDELNIITGTLQDILQSQDFLKDFEINVPTANTECLKSFIMRHVSNSNGTMLLDCGLALDLEIPENTNN
jgi:hypothetical protein